MIFFILKSMFKGKKDKDLRSFRGRKVTVMGLGLNGGGMEVCRFLGRLGADLTVTDLRSPEDLAPSMELLKEFPIHYVLGEHRMEDFQKADLVIKNPAIPSESPFLQAAKAIETDISLFLRFSDNPIIAVTGSKGKSTVVTALHHILKTTYPGCRLGGNITVSPLSFLHELDGISPVILELSSWQLADLRDRDLLKPEISLITNIMHDHQNRYASMDDYVADKEEIFLNQIPGQTALFPLNKRGRTWAAKTKARVCYFSLDNTEPEGGESLTAYIKDGRGYVNTDKGAEEILPDEFLVPGAHFRLNMLLAGAAAALYGIPAESIKSRLADFPGVPHRMEKIGSREGITFYNDTAATIPDALMAALESFEKPPLLICGGTDKELDLSPLDNLEDKAKGLFFLTGSASDRMIPYAEKSRCPYWGPYETLEEAFGAALKEAVPGDNIILSPGATSFGMFLNEFDRGNRFAALAREEIGGGA